MKADLGGHLINNQLDTKARTANSTLAIGGVSCFVETFVQGSTFVLRMNFSAKNPALRQAAKRYASPYDDRQC